MTILSVISFVVLFIGVEVAVYAAGVGKGIKLAFNYKDLQAELDRFRKSIAPEIEKDAPKVENEKERVN